MDTVPVDNTARTVKSVHGSNPQALIEKVIRARIYDSLYWKEHCFALTAETLIDKAIALKAIGGVYERQTPTPFMCLLLRLLQLQPEKEILFEYLLAEEFKYLRALATIYIRLTFRSLEIYTLLEPLMKDYRKLRVRGVGGYSLTTFDEFVDDLLTQERVCDIILPRMTQRAVLEEVEGLAPRRSLLEGEDGEGGSDGEGEREGEGDKSDEEGDRSEEEDGEEGDTRYKNRYISRSPSRSRSRSRSPSRDASRSQSRSRSRSVSSSGSRPRYVSRSPSRSRSLTPSDGERGDTRFVSRSPSVSPDRAMDVDDERIAGDV